MINDGKTCEGCIYFTTMDCRIVPDELEAKKDADYCDHFEPNLEYRRTVALESLAELIGGCIRISEGGGFEFEVGK